MKNLRTSQGETGMISKEIGRPIEILLVEDNPGDVRLILEALKDAKIRNVVQIGRASCRERV